jgi:hypothetical protein
MKSKILIGVASLAILSGCGKETIREVLVTTPPTTVPAVEENKYDLFLKSMYDNSAQSRAWEEADLFELGSAVCESFSAGNTLAEVVDIFSDYSSGLYDDEFFAAVIGSSVTFLCPENAAYVDAQI